jgi:hypothetical protein
MFTDSVTLLFSFLGHNKMEAWWRCGLMLELNAFGFIALVRFEDPMS